MNIGILGSGNVGGTLGARWAKLGHKVVFGTRDQESLKNAVRESEVVVAALPWNAVKGVVESLDLQGKIVLDCTNPLKADLSGVEIGTTTSGGEQVTQWARGASVVKIFNTTGFSNMENPIYGGQPTAMFYCGGDQRAKAAASKLATDLGFDPIDAGPIENARLLEPLAMLWIWLAIKGGLGRDFALKLVHR
ncbi:MAG: NADPH-dependent F420 reductase [Bryobacteraceae bacterium]